MLKKWFPPLQHLQAANLVTSLVMACGASAVLLVLQGHVRAALLLNALAILFDRLDGLVARALKLESPFGEQIDSLADALSFCLLPAVIAYALGFDTGWAVPVLTLYVVAGLWRLGHFNLTGLVEAEGRSSYFTGIPTTVAASWFVILSPLVLQLEGAAVDAVCAVYFAAASLLMISGIPYPKYGLPTKLLYVLVPAAVAAALFWK